MNRKAEEIRQRFAGKLISRKDIQKLVYRIIQIFPKDIIDFITKNV